MGDARHKNPPPPSEDEEDVTDDFRRDAKATMSRNGDLNDLRKAIEGDPGYLIDSQASLARELTRRLGRTVSDKHISNILGPVRKGSNWDRVDRSTYVKPIREALNMPTMVTISVPASRAGIVQSFASLPDQEFGEFADALSSAHQRTRAATSSKVKR